MTEMNEKWFNMEQAANESGLSRPTLNKAIRDGRLKARQISDSSRWGFHYMVSENALLEFVEDRKTVKANAIATSKAASEMTIEDLAKEITLRIQKAYAEGVKDGKKEAKAEMIQAARNLK